jgi:hypothetical protein
MTKFFFTVSSYIYIYMLRTNVTRTCFCELLPFQVIDLWQFGHVYNPRHISERLLLLESSKPRHISEQLLLLENSYYY